MPDIKNFLGLLENGVKVLCIVPESPVARVL